MKLVDILARELKEWPERADWVVSVAEPGGRVTASFGCGNFPVPDPFDRNFHTWSVLRTGGQWEIVSRSNISQKPVDRLEAIVTRAQWQAAVDALKAGEEFVPFDFSDPVLDYESKEWTGEGLPPVGAVCERSFGREIWKSTTICGHSTDGAYAAFYDGDGLMGWSDDCKFRPIRTQEQIAAEAREAAIKDLMQLDDIYYDQAAAIYDAGYRKVSP